MNFPVISRNRILKDPCLEMKKRPRQKYPYLQGPATCLKCCRKLALAQLRPAQRRPHAAGWPFPPPALTTQLPKSKYDPEIITRKNVHCRRTQACHRPPCRKATRSGSNLSLNSAGIYIHLMANFFQ